MFRGKKWSTGIFFLKPAFICPSTWSILNTYFCNSGGAGQNSSDALTSEKMCLEHIDGLVQERRNSVALAMELCLSCTNPSIYSDGSVQDCSISSALAMEILQSCTEPLILQFTGLFQVQWVNSLTPGRCGCKLKCKFQTCVLSISCEIAFRWLPLDHTDDYSILVHVMALCCQATRYYLNQCWPKCLMPGGITRPQWVNVFEMEICDI